MSKSYMCECCAAIKWDDIPLVMMQDDQAIQTSDGVRIVGFTNLELRLFSALCNTFPRVASRDFLYDFLYGDCADDVSLGIIKTLIQRIRLTLTQHETKTSSRLNFLIETANLNGYRIVLRSGE